MKRECSWLLRLFAITLALVPVVCAPAFGASPMPLNSPTSAGPAIQTPNSPLQGTVPRLPGTMVSDGQIMNVTSPTGQGMYLGTTVKIQWEWPGYINYPADVTLWDEVTQPWNYGDGGTMELWGRP